MTDSQIRAVMVAGIRPAALRCLPAIRIADRLHPAIAMGLAALEDHAVMIAGLALPGLGRDEREIRGLLATIAFAGERLIDRPHGGNPLAESLAARFCRRRSR